MEYEHQPHQGIRSKASVVGHPIHPMLIAFPIGLLVAAFPTDLAYWGTGDDFWARASFWLTAAGLITGVLAAVFGMVDFLAIPHVRQHRAGWIHFLGNALALGLAAVSLLVRWEDMAEGVLPWGLVLSAVITLLLVITGWYGGELSYRHMIGVTGHDR